MSATDATTGSMTGATSDVSSTGAGPACGDGNVDPGEECDDANDVETDACTNSCANAVCGDNIIGPGEACDDGNQVDDDMCSNTCALGSCGDGKLQMGEACDDGNADDTDACLSTCLKAACGDSAVQAGVEECDDGNAEDTDACLSTCKNATCGDMIVQAGVEECDDANMVDTDACTNMCKTAKCGDMVVQMGVEECDDGNMADTDACTSMCKTAKCGDMLVQMGVEECDDANMVNTDACTNTCKTAKCGDAVVQAGVEECDDGNMVQTDACINTCKTAKCGDTFVQAMVESCDDGNANPNDGCGVLCLKEGNKIYLTSSNGQPGFHEYTISTNAWATRASPPTTTRSQITNDGTLVYLLGGNNVIYRYTPANNTWAVDPTPGPNAGEAGTPIGYFKWTNQGFYYLRDGSANLRHFKNNAWTLVTLPGPASSAGSWDRANNELYIRTWAQLGFRVLNTTNDMVVRTITDAVNVGENSRTGSLSGGFFYSRTFTGTLQKLDKTSGMKTDTMQKPTSDHTASDTDLSSGLIYLSGYSGQATIFQRYNPLPNTLTNLANSPAVPDHSTITVMLPPP